MDSSSAPTDSLKLLIGETITSVDVNGVNAVEVYTASGRRFTIVVEAVMPTYNIYGMLCELDG